jgi:hypothetical protein
VEETISTPAQTFNGEILMPIVRLLGNHVVVSPPGSIVNVFGHKFVIQENGEAHADIDEGFIKDEVAAGRVQLVSTGMTSNPYADKDPDPPRVETPKVETSRVEPLITDMFPGDASDYFGCKNMQGLNEKLRGLNKPEIKLFANLCAKIETPNEMGKSTMIIKACTAVDEMAKKFVPEVDGEES